MWSFSSYQLAPVSSLSSFSLFISFYAIGNLLPRVNGDCLFRNQWLKDDKFKTWVANYRTQSQPESGATDVYKIAKCNIIINYGYFSVRPSNDLDSLNLVV